MSPETRAAVLKAVMLAPKLTPDQMEKLRRLLAAVLRG